MIILGYLTIGFSFTSISTEWREAGVITGKIAIILLWIVALPGILKRLGVQGFLKQIYLFLWPARRRLGILVFIFAFMHYLWVRLFFIILFGPPTLDLVPVFEIFGLIALFLLLFLYITSNDFSVKTLKKNWQRLHYLVYPTLWILVLHIVLQPPFTVEFLGIKFNLENLIYFALPTIVIASLQIYSWVFVFQQRQFRKKSY